MSIEINFTNRETYLAWRANWRAIYKAQSEEIRQNKRDIKAAYANQKFDRASSLQQELCFNRRLATRMMDTLEEAKELSKAAREANSKQAAAA
jgi:hypothetical protein